MRTFLIACALGMGCGEITPADVPTEQPDSYDPELASCADVMPTETVSDVLGAEVRLVPESGRHEDLRCMYSGTQMAAMSSASVRVDCNNPDLSVPAEEGREPVPLTDVGPDAWISVDEVPRSRFAVHMAGAAAPESGCTVRVETMGLPHTSTTQLTRYAVLVANAAEGAAS